MKKIFYIIYIIASFFLFNSLPLMADLTKTEFSFEQNVEEIFVVSDTSFFYKLDNKLYFYEDTNSYLIDDVMPKKIVVNLNEAYFIYDDYISIFNISTKVKDEILVDDAIDVLKKDDHYFVLSGKVDLILTCFDNRFDEEYYLVLGGKAEEKGLNIVVLSDAIYVSGKFCYPSLNSNLLQIKDEGSSFGIIKLKLDGTILSERYFDDEFLDLKANEQNLFLYFKDSFLLLDDALNIIEDSLIENPIYCFANYLSDDPLYIDDSYILHKEKSLASLNRGKKIELVNGALYISNWDISGITITKYKSLEVLKNDIHYAGMGSYDEMDTLSVKLASLFEKLSLKDIKIRPYFNKLSSGKYIRKLIYEATDQSLIEIENEMIVLDYHNFIDGGIYNRGFSLSFFGDLKINGNTLFNGATLNEVGEYELELTDINGFKKAFHISIVDDYYNDQPSSQISAPLYLESYDSFILNDEELELKYGFHHLEYNDQSYFFVKKKTSPKVVSDAILNEDSINLSFNISDPDTTFVKLILNKDANLDIYKHQVINLKKGEYNLDLNYFDLENSKNINLVSLKTSEKIVLEVIPSYANGKLEKVDVTISGTSFPKTMNELVVNEANIGIYYKEYEESPILKTMLITSLIIFLMGTAAIIAIYLIKRKCLKKLK